LTADILTDKTKSALPLRQAAIARTEVTEDPGLINLVPESADIRFIFFIFHYSSPSIFSLVF